MERATQTRQLLDLDDAVEWWARLGKTVDGDDAMDETTCFYGRTAHQLLASCTPAELARDEQWFICDVAAKRQIRGPYKRDEAELYME